MRSPSHAGLVGYLMTYYWPHTFIGDVGFVCMLFYRVGCCSC